MNLLQSRLKFRQRTPWEAVDLGRRLIGANLSYYMTLYAVLMLPFFLLGGVLFATLNMPGWWLIFLWWCKPMYEYGILSALSIHAFQPLPPLKSAIRTGFRLMLRPCVFGDVTWRRFRLTRSFVNPIQQLEQLHGQDYRSRQRELSRYGSSTATGLSVLGNSLEGIWMYALMILAYWFLYGNFIQQGLVQPSHMQEFSTLLSALFESWANKEVTTVLKYTPWAYFITLAFWGPFYVAGGFTLYLNARTQSEAWDIRLAWQQLRERLRGGVTWCVAICLATLLVLAHSEPSYAEPLPDEQKVTQSKEQVLERDPFYHVEQKNKWCWLSCDKKPAKSAETPLNLPVESPANATLLQPFGYLVLGLLVLGVLYALWHWLSNRGDALDKTHQAVDVPTTMFGLDVRTEALPHDVSAQALALLQTNPRAALSLLYRATLSQLINKQHLPIKQHHTEGNILQLVAQKLAMLSPFFQSLTRAWLHIAYGHQQLPIADLQALCEQYAHHFEQRNSA